MRRKKFLQLGVVVLVATLIVTGLLVSFKKKWLRTSAEGEVLPGSAQKLEAFLPSVANDIPQNYWAYKYIDAILKYKVPATGEGMIPILGSMTETEDNTYFGPGKTIDDFGLGVFASRIANVTPKATCAGNYYSDLPATHWACKYIEAAADKGVYWGTYKPSKTSPLSAFDEDTSRPATVGRLKGILLHLGIAQNTPAGMPAVSDSSDLTRERFAAFTVFNMNLPGDEPKRSTVLRFFAPDPSAIASSSRNPRASLIRRVFALGETTVGTDLGYEIYRQAPGETTSSYILGVDPPETGLVETPDFGLAYDHPEKSGTYLYTVYYFNREGAYTNPASVSVNVP